MTECWETNNYFDKATQSETKKLKADLAEYSKAFFTDLKFGTGGLRGIMGVGSARMNIYTVRRATQGIANYLKKGKVVIGFDSRHNSELFAKEAARVFAGNGISVFLCPEIRPTPFISFACRHLQAEAAIMITASHNPKEYNGYKVFWEDGSQVVPPHDIGIMQEMDKISSYAAVSLAPLDSPLIQKVDSSVDTAYINAITSLPFFHSPKSHLEICYSSLHGTGITLLPRALIACGFSSPHLVSSQCIPDGDFSAAPSPNPETPEALSQGIELLEATQSDLLFVTDPDADRLGVAIMHRGKPRILTGQELAALATYYLCLTDLNPRPGSPRTIITTIVTTPLVNMIGASFQKKVIRTLTGFKYIGEQIGKDPSNFLLGVEESNGYLIGSYCRDKDGVSAACLFAMLAADLKKEGKTCLDLLHEIYAQFGAFQEKTLSLNFSEGQEGLQEIATLMNSLRTSPPRCLAGKKLHYAIDYLAPQANFPKANVLQWVFEGGTSLIVRPSGTEPKLKVYLNTAESVGAGVDVLAMIEKCQKTLEEMARDFSVAINVHNLAP